MWSPYSQWLVGFLVTITEAASILAPSRANLTSPLSLNLSSAFNVNRISFQDTVRHAILTTIALYPEAGLVSIQASTTGNPTNDPRRLKDVQMTFRIPPRPPYRTIIVAMSGLWGRWAPPQLSPKAAPDDRGTLPIDLGMDLSEADQLIKGRGYTQRYWWAEVVWPRSMPREMMQVFYVFEMEGEGPGSPDVVIVGASDRRVTAIPNARAGYQWLSGE